MKIKQLIPVSNDNAVLATRKADFTGFCYDQQGDGHSFFWAVMEGDADYVELLDVDVNGGQRVCERRLVVPRKPCPFCNHQMEPCYDNAHQPAFWQECPTCGYILDMRSYEDEERCSLEGGASNDD